MKSLVTMSARSRINLLFFLSIGVIFLIIAIVVPEQMGMYKLISDFNDELVKDFLKAYLNGFPHPWL